jgi:hypothetical protein
MIAYSSGSGAARAYLAGVNIAIIKAAGARRQGYQHIGGERAPISVARAESVAVAVRAAVPCREVAPPA